MRQSLRSAPLKEWEGRLPAQPIFRVHRIAIVDFEHEGFTKNANEQTFHASLYRLSESYR